MTEVPVEALRTLFLNDLLSRPLTTPSQEKQTGGLVQRLGVALGVEAQKNSRWEILPQARRTT